MSGVTVIQKIEMSQSLLSVSSDRESVVAFALRCFQKLLDFFLRQIIQSRPGAGRCIEWQRAEISAVFQVLDQGSIERRCQIGNTDESAADEL